MPDPRSFTWSAVFWAIVVGVSALATFSGVLIVAYESYGRLPDRVRSLETQMEQQGEGVFQMRATSDYLQWRSSELSAWNNLIPLEAIRGPAGQSGEAGPSGPPIELSVADSQVRWRPWPGAQWLDLFSLKSLEGVPVDSELESPNEANVPSFAGTWRGTYDCRKGDRTGTIWMQIEVGVGGLDVTERYTRNGTTGASTYNVESVGERYLHLSADEDGHGEGFEYDMVLTLSPEGDEISGRYIGHPNCTTITMTAR